MSHIVLTLSLKHPADIYLWHWGPLYGPGHNPLALPESMGKETDICSLRMLTLSLLSDPALVDQREPVEILD